MKTIYLSEESHLSGGGPNIFCYKFSSEIKKRGYNVIYDNPNLADVAVCINKTDKIIGKIDKNKTKVILRIGGIYNKYYNRLDEEKLIELYSQLKRDLSYVDKVVFLSHWSKDTVLEEIDEINNDKCVAIHNGVDLNIFKPIPRQNDGFINLLNIGNMRNGYFMEALVGAYKELNNRGIKVRLNLVGSMDKECRDVLRNFNDPGIGLVGASPNDKLSQVYSQGDIFLSVRVGGTGDNTVIEAQSCGLPVVCASYSGNGELIVDGETGFVVESGKCEYGKKYNNNIADAVEKIIIDLDCFKKRSREHAVRTSSVETMANEYLRVMNE
jgi:glycosyltransferase involved in cell wall biosynthesis